MLERLKLTLTYQNTLTYKTQALKRRIKSTYRNNLNEINMTYIFFTQPTWALPASLCIKF